MSDIVSFDDLDAQFSSIGLEKASIDTIKKIHKQVFRKQTGDAFDLSGLFEALEADPNELNEIINTCEDMKTKNTFSFKTPLLDIITSSYEEAFNNEGGTQKLSLTFLNKMKAKKKRTKFIQRKEKNEQRGKTYKEKLKLKIDRKSKKNKYKAYY